MTDQEKIDLLATEVMEWHREIHFRDLEDQYGDTYWVDKTGLAVAKDGLWNPLKNIADAWHVLKKLEAVGWEWELKAANYLHPSIKLTNDLLLKVIYAHGEDEAKTICNAAIKTLEVKVHETTTSSH